MNKLEKINFIGHVFMNGAKIQMSQEWVIVLAAIVGLSQGSFKQGIIGGLAIFGTCGAVGSVLGIMDNWDKIKNL
ncbi:MAG TPA: hypothetical protein P5123_06610 [Spirochaetota bacterium]|nr:hypothetical protein [Spirochaetota bacterium]